MPQGRYENTYQLQDTLTWIKGSHTMKFGFDVEDQRIRNQINFNVLRVDRIYRAGWGLYSAGELPGQLRRHVSTSGGDAEINYGNPVSMRPAHSGSRVTLPKTIGRLRITSRWTSDCATSTTARRSTTCRTRHSIPIIRRRSRAACRRYRTTRTFGPRAGFNYAFNDKTVVSGGVGFFYSHVFTNITNNIQGSSPNNSSKDLITSASGRGTANWSTILATTYNTPASQLAGPTDTSNVNSAAPAGAADLRVQSAGPTRNCLRAFVLAVEYVGSRTEHQYATTEFNPILFNPNTFATPRLFPTRGRIIREDNTADANYNSGQVELQHKSARYGLTFRGAYTYSKLLDDGSGGIHRIAVRTFRPMPSCSIRTTGGGNMRRVGLSITATASWFRLFISHRTCACRARDCTGLGPVVNGWTFA